MKNNIVYFLLIVFLISSQQLISSELASLGLHVIPYPKQVETGGPDFVIPGKLTLILDNKSSASDLFTAKELITDLKRQFGIESEIGAKGKYPAIRLTRFADSKSIPKQGYKITTGKSELVIQASSDDGLFYGTQTMLQLILKKDGEYVIPGINITDRPDIQERAVHYDTKHHQDKPEYVKSFIKDLSRYKINILVWEWEDKFAYPSHPEIGAPGAFTIKEMQDFTRFAKQYHIQIVPLVQGLGHVSFILKWPKYKPLREIEASNWEFCPLKQGSYDLLFDLWQDAVKATPGSNYIHIGCDEVYELGACENCKAEIREIGKDGLTQLFINKGAEYLKKKGRKVMVWRSPLSWKSNDKSVKKIEPVSNLVFRAHPEMVTPGYTECKEAKSLGFEVFAYDPNARVVPLFVPYIFEKSEDSNGLIEQGSLERSNRFLTSAAQSGAFKGMISAAWDDDDLHNQMWMMHYVNAATWAWNGSKPASDEFRESFFSSYYGNSALKMAELFELMNEGAYYFAGTMERNVWHYGEIGKTRLPDLPRGDALEYDPFWNTEYKEKVSQSQVIRAKMDQALQIIDKNKNAGVKNGYDFELFRTSAELIKHTCQTYLDLSNLENAIKEAHANRFVDCNVSLANLLKAQRIVESILQRRGVVFNDLVSTYEKTQFPKGYSINEKPYFWQQDRARHFANRRPDMSFLICDEQKLDLEGYLSKLKDYTDFFKKNSMN